MTRNNKKKSLPFQFPPRITGATDLKTAVDAIAQEGIWWDGIGGNDDWNDSEGYDYASCCTDDYLPRLRKYRNAGFPVFVCDYALKKAEEVYQNAAAEGFIAYATRRSLSKLTTTPPEFEKTNLPIIAVNKTQLNFTAIINASSPGSQALSISNSGDGTLNWTITDNATWLTCNPDSVTDSAHVTVSVDAAGLGTGTYAGTITISAPDSSNSPQTVEVTLNVYLYGEDDEPFGSFVTPVDGSTLGSGVAVTGWALTPLPNSIPTGGSTINVFLDGVNLGHPHCNGYRQDIAVLFPGYANSNVAIGSTFDREGGIFYWQPGPGFLGHHQLVFFKKRLSGEIKGKRIIIIIVPRFTKTE